MGWALTDTLAAASWGMPIVGTRRPSCRLLCAYRVRASCCTVNTRGRTRHRDSRLHHCRGTGPARLPPACRPLEHNRGDLAGGQPCRRSSRHRPRPRPRPRNPQPVGAQKGSYVPGDAIILVGDRGGRIRSFVDALTRFPAEPQWSVVGGFAVNIRITHVHRLTNDLDTVSRDQTSLVETLVTKLNAGRPEEGQPQTASKMPITA